MLGAQQAEFFGVEGRLAPTCNGYEGRVLASVDWRGDYPTWLAAVGTTAAVIAALALADREARHRKNGSLRDQLELRHLAPGLGRYPGCSPGGIRGKAVYPRVNRNRVFL